MTREEAIEWLKMDVELTKFDPSTGRQAYLSDEDRQVLEAKEMAIEALKEEPRPTGHWRDDGETLWCSNCGYGEGAYFGCYDVPFEFNGCHGWARRKPAYCKRCGAKMEAEK